MVKKCTILCWWSVFLIFTLEEITGKKHIMFPLSKENNVTHLNLNEYRYDKESMVLTKLESTSACKANMRFFASPTDETLGECDCDYFECSRPLLYSTTTKQCYFAWTQGPCGNDQVFEFDDMLKPVCNKNVCPKAKSNNPMAPFYFRSELDDQCYEVGSKAYCEDDDEFLGTSLEEPIPSCRRFALCGGWGHPATQQCIAGHKLEIEGKCGHKKSQKAV